MDRRQSELEKQRHAALRAIGLNGASRFILPLISKQEVEQRIEEVKRRNGFGQRAVFGGIAPGRLPGAPS